MTDHATTTALNRRFGIGNVLRFAPGAGGLACALIRNDLAAATIFLHGAHVTSYVPHGHQDLLWISAHSHYAPNKPIRGGIPVCWPWFCAHPGDPRLPAHGFARLRAWQVVGSAVLTNGATRLVLSLPGHPGDDQSWPHPVALAMTITVGTDLAVELTTANPGDTAFTFTAALHTYLRVADIAAITIGGLRGRTYLDTVGGGRRRGRQTGTLTIAGETDRTYLDTIGPCLVRDPGLGRTIRVAKRGSRTTVVWNPWIAKSARMPDFGDEEYRTMLCVEAANAAKHRITLASGQHHRLKTIVGISQLDQA